MQMSDINVLLTGHGFGVVSGYAATGQKLPYVANRPLLLDHDGIDPAVTGDAFGWDYQFSLYCCAGSVEAAFNLAQLVISLLQGARVGGSTLDATMGYDGAQVEGHYEAQVTVQIHQGVLS